MIEISQQDEPERLASVFRDRSDGDDACAIRSYWCDVGRSSEAPLDLWIWGASGPGALGCGGPILDLDQSR